MNSVCRFLFAGETPPTSPSLTRRPSRPTPVVQPTLTPFPSTRPAPIITRRVRDPGWAYEAGVTGLISSVLILGLGIASEATNEGGKLVPSLPLGGSALLIAAGAVPLVAAGATSARERSGLRENAFLRIMGWGFYGASMTVGFILTLVGVSSQIPTGLITTTTVLGIGSVAIMTVDAFQARNEALALSPTGILRANENVSRGSLTLAPKLDAGRLRGLVLGWGGSF
ncbi:MAG: hypothetical protein HYY84_06655 [Deltaproteobacteria bacterium]|nr:hypothetical protein [Deltaproteobacteria bacterium]